MSTVIFTLLKLWKTNPFRYEAIVQHGRCIQVGYTARMKQDDIARAAQQLWDYMLLDSSIADADCLLVLGSRDDRVAAYAAELAQAYIYGALIVSGGLSPKNDVRADLWKSRTEAEHFRDIMQQAGCQQTILLENRAVNTGQNLKYSYEMMSKEKLKHETIVIVTKPYMERRVKATFDVQWPTDDTKASIVSPSIPFSEYFNDIQPFDKTVSIMVGDMDRIIQYPRMGYQSEQPISRQVKHAFETLKAAGYTDYLLK